MKFWILLIIIAAIGWQAYDRWDHNRNVALSERAFTAMETALPAISAGTSAPAKPWSPSSNPPVRARFTCDGRTHCSQMSSCEEATYFLKNCPNTKMDGNGDGVPCEKQWCTN